MYTKRKGYVFAKHSLSQALNSNQSCDVKLRSSAEESLLEIVQLIPVEKHNKVLDD